MNLNEECLLQYLQKGPQSHLLTGRVASSAEGEPRLFPSVYRRRNFVSFPLDLLLAQIQRILI